LPEILTPDWRAPPNVRAAITTRRGGVSRGPHASLNLGSHVEDDPEAVRRNRALLRAQLALPAEPCWLNQTHGTELVEAAFAAQPPAADAAFSRTRGQVCAILTADCLPILLCNRSGTTVLAIHAGWRGLLDGIIARCVQTLAEDPAQWMAWIGPGISGDAYEVGPELVTRFTTREPRWSRYFAPLQDKMRADLPALAADQLAMAGITDITRYAGCTASEPERFFSYRRDGLTGRFASLIWLT